MHIIFKSKPNTAVLILVEDMDATYFTNAAVTTLGAILDREECRKTIVCNACNAIKKMVPASQVAVVLADHYLPQDVKHWDKYTVAKRVFLNEQGERCEEIYHCSFDVGSVKWDNRSNEL